MTEKSWNIADRLESCMDLMHLLNMTSIYSVYHDPFGHPLATCIPIKSTSQDSSSSLDALLCRVLWTLYGFSLEFIFVSFLFAVCRSVCSFIPEVMLAKGNARFVAQVFCTWRPEAKFQWNLRRFIYLFPAYQILAKELDDVIVHCQISFGHVSFGLVLWGQLWIAGALGMHFFLSGHTPRDVWLAGNAAQGLCRSQCNLEAICLLVGWTFQNHHGSGSLVSFGKVGRFLEGSCIRSICEFPADNRGSIQKEVFGRGRFQIKLGGRFRKIPDKVKQNPSMNFVFNILLSASKETRGNVRSSLHLNHQVCVDLMSFCKPGRTSPTSTGSLRPLLHWHSWAASGIKDGDLELFGYPKKHVNDIQMIIK